MQILHFKNSGKFSLRWLLLTGWLDVQHCFVLYTSRVANNYVGMAPSDVMSLRLSPLFSLSYTTAQTRSLPDKVIRQQPPAYHPRPIVTQPTDLLRVERSRRFLPSPVTVAFMRPVVRKICDALYFLCLLTKLEGMPARAAGIPVRSDESWVISREGCTWVSYGCMSISRMGHRFEFPLEYSIWNAYTVVEGHTAMKSVACLDCLIWLLFLSTLRLLKVWRGCQIGLKILTTLKADRLIIKTTIWPISLVYICAGGDLDPS